MFLFCNIDWIPWVESGDNIMSILRFRDIESFSWFNNHRKIGLSFRHDGDKALQIIIYTSRCAQLQDTRLAAGNRQESFMGSCRESGKISGLGSKGFEGQFFKDNLKHGRCNTLRTYTLLNISRVDYHLLSLKNRETFMFVTFRASGNVKDFLKPLFLTLGPPNYSTYMKKNTKPTFGFCVFKSEPWTSDNL